MSNTGGAETPPIPKWVGWSAVGVFAAIIAGCALTAGHDNEPNLDQQHKDAIRVCEGFVKDRIAAPGLAQFSDEHAAGSTNTSVTVSGTVDSPTRSTYSCTVVLDGDNWRLDDLTVG